jgi:type IV secretory pathway VirJ component
MVFDQFGPVPVFRPAGEPAQVVILLSGDQGIGDRETAVATALAAAGSLVFAFDVPRYVQTVVHSKTRCLSPGTELHQLGQNGQARLNLAAYHPPLLVGVGSGGTFAFATLAQAAPGTWAGAVSLGFCPVLRIGKKLCPADGLGWDDAWTGPGYRLLPDRELVEPWIVLESPASEDCPVVSAPGASDIVASMPTASRLPLPAGLSPEAAQDAWKGQLQQALASITQRQKDQEAARRAQLRELADLPLVEVPAGAPEVDAFAVDLTGSGGYEGLDVDLGRELAAQGVPVVALSALEYFWINRDPAGMSRDLGRILDHYLQAWHKKKAILIGYSQGADIIPFMVTRLPAAQRSRIAAIGLVGPDDKAELDMGLAGFMTNRKAPAPLPVAPEIARLTGFKVVCVYGTREKFSICPSLDPKLGVELFTVGGGHAFRGDAPRMIAQILRAGGLPVRGDAQLTSDPGP